MNERIIYLEQYEVIYFYRNGEIIASYMNLSEELKKVTVKEIRENFCYFTGTITDTFTQIYCERYEVRTLSDND